MIMKQPHLKRVTTALEQGCVRIRARGRVALGRDDMGWRGVSAIPFCGKPVAAGPRHHNRKPGTNLAGVRRCGRFLVALVEVLQLLLCVGVLEAGGPHRCGGGGT